MILLIDDMRNFTCDIIARNATSAKKIFTLDVTWELVMFDHDLGEVETGYDVMKFMFEHYIFPKEIQIITSNPVGRINMEGLLKDYQYSCYDGVNWERRE